VKHLKQAEEEFQVKTPETGRSLSDRKTDKRMKTLFEHLN